MKVYRVLLVIAFGLTFQEKDKRSFFSFPTHERTYIALKRRIGMGAQVKKTARIRKDFLPQASERAPSKGAERKDRIP